VSLPLYSCSRKAFCQALLLSTCRYVLFVPVKERRTLHDISRLDTPSMSGNHKGVRFGTSVTISAFDNLPAHPRMPEADLRALFSRREDNLPLDFWAAQSLHHGLQSSSKKHRVHKNNVLMLIRTNLLSTPTDMIYKYADLAVGWAHTVLRIAGQTTEQIQRHQQANRLEEAEDLKLEAAKRVAEVGAKEEWCKFPYPSSFFLASYSLFGLCTPS